MPKPRSSTNKSKRLQPVAPVTQKPDPYDIAMRRLGLDWRSIDQLAEEYKVNGDDIGLVLTMVLLRRLLKLLDMRPNAPEAIDNYISFLIDRLYRSTHHCEGEAGRFAAETDKAIRAKNRPSLVSERRVS